MKRAAIYCRVSTEDQAKSGYSLPDQVASCQTHLLKMGITDTVEYVDDGYSGEFIDRPALTNMREDIAAGRIDLVVVYDPDRLARNLSIQLLLSNELESAQIPLHFVTGNYDSSPEGKLFFSMRGAISEYEKAKILDRTIRGKRRKSAEGKIIQDFGLYGYDYCQEDHSYIINEEQANMIKEIYRLALDKQLSVQRLQKELKSRVIPSPTGKLLWSTSTLYKILTNRSYTGTFVSMQKRYKKSGIKKRTETPRPESEWINISIPVIIDDITFERVQKQLKQNRAVRKHSFSYPYLVSGILYCGICGRRMIVHQNAMPNGTYKPYYQCATQRYYNLRNAGITCSSRAIPADAFDAYLWDLLVKAFTNPEYLQKYIPKVAPPDTKELDRIAKLETELIKRREILARWFRQQMVSEKEAEAELLQIKEQLDDIQKRKAILQPATHQQNNFSLSVEQFQEIIKHDITPEQKKLIIKAVFSKVIATRIDKRLGTLSTKIPPEFSIEWELI